MVAPSKLVSEQQSLLQVRRRFLFVMDLRSFVMLKFLLPLFREREAKRVADAGFFANIVAAMTVNGPEDINGLIAAWSNGDEEAFGRLMSLVYPELRRIARQHLSRRPAGHSLESAALANEAYLKLVRARGLRCESRVHFLALCSQIIRRSNSSWGHCRSIAERARRPDGGSSVLRQ